MIKKMVLTLGAFLLVACALFTGPAATIDPSDELPVPTLTYPPVEDLPAIEPPATPTAEVISADDQLALKNEWNRAIVSAEIMFAICEMTYNNHILLQKGTIDQAKAQGEMEEKANFLAEVQGILSGWKDISPRVEPYFHDLDNLSYEMADLISRLMSGEIGSQEITQPLDDTCLALFNAQDEVIGAAVDAGLTTDSIMKIEQEGINDILNEIYD